MFSSRHYGVELAQDQFEVFIEKNDEIPTAEPRWMRFETQMPNQRMICIPVYGGDNLEKASANEKQGEVFAVLPPGLPKGTVVRVSLSLNADEIFCPAARLEDGPDLKPWVITGGADQKAIEAFNEVDRDLAQLATAFSQSAQEAIEKHKEQILKNLHDGDYQDAQRGIEQLRQLATAISSVCD
jgi:molecular chaperone DnaK (HSP70)